MRVIITGGTGLIGTALADSLLKDQHDVIVLSRNPSKVKHLSPAARVVEWDGRTPTGWYDLITEDTSIVNLAGAGIADGRWTAGRKRALRDSRTVSGSAVTQGIDLSITLKDKKPASLIQASAVGFYGNRGDEIITETSTPGDDFLASVCRDWEASTAAVEAMGVRRAIIRTGVVLSTMGGAFPLMAMPFYVFTGGPVGSGRQYMPWIHIKDQVRAIRYMIENEEAAGVYNVTAPNPVTNRDFGKALGQTLARPSFFPAPAFAMKAALGEMSTILLDGQRAVPKRLLDEGFTFDYPVVQEALDDLMQEESPELVVREEAMAYSEPTEPLRKRVERVVAAPAAAAAAAKGGAAKVDKKALVKAKRKAALLTKKGEPIPADLQAILDGAGAAAPAAAAAPVAEAVAEAVGEAAPTAAGGADLSALDPAARRAEIRKKRAARLARIKAAG